MKRKQESGPKEQPKMKEMPSSAFPRKLYRELQKEMKRALFRRRIKVIGSTFLLVLAIGRLAWFLLVPLSRRDPAGQVDAGTKTASAYKPEQYGNHTPVQRLVTRAYLETSLAQAKALSQKRAWEMTARLCQSVISRCGPWEAIDDFLFLAGDSCARLGDTRRAAIFYSRILREFPYSARAKDARQAFSRIAAHGRFLFGVDEEPGLDLKERALRVLDHFSGTYMECQTL